ncbi:hypothetical protein ACF068_04885 [Streptomyces sp. NPDC016309]|uniref:hypothetical protein n=1 Tax=Streptomyces sp. NPDC016309 TaxID=3364965 RepID=UPI0036F4E41B
MVGVLRRTLGTVVRPGEDSAPWTYSTAAVCAAAFVGSGYLLPVLGAVGGLRHPAVALVAYCALSATLGLRAHPRAVPLCTAVCWLFYDGFVVHQQGELAWQGLTDAYRIGLLTAAALLGTAVARAGRARDVRRGQPATRVTGRLS